MKTAKRFKVRVSVYRGNGHYDTDEEIVEADNEAEATQVLWDMLANMHVETGVEELEE